jgi:hypothetical protein
LTNQEFFPKRVWGNKFCNESPYGLVAGYTSPKVFLEVLRFIKTVFGIL